jgi:hypothetical protein
MTGYLLYIFNNVGVVFRAFWVRLSFFSFYHMTHDNRAIILYLRNFLTEFSYGLMCTHMIGAVDFAFLDFRGVTHPPACHVLL